jgi:hypothetical protein
MTQEELQELLTSFEKKIGHIKEWEFERADRLRAQASDAVKAGIKKGSYKKNGGVNNQNLTPVIVTDYKTGKFIAKYRSISDCAKQMGLYKGDIHKVVKGIYKQCKGYCFNQ